MWEYDLEFAGQKAGDYLIKIMERPNIPSPIIRNNEVDLPGRDGLLYSCDETVDDILISVNMNFTGEPNKWFEYVRGAKAWLLRTGQHKLKFGDDTDYFYKVKKVEVSEFERVHRRIGAFTASFFCYGYHYLEAGTRRYQINDVRMNPYHTAHPVYMVEGEGICTLTVNGKEMIIKNVGQNVTVDTERMIAYREDGAIANTSVVGDYEDLYLNPGMNEIGVTRGFTLIVIPNWRCL